MKKQQKTLALWIVVILIMAFAMKALEKKDEAAKQITYSEFINAVEGDKVKEVTFKGSTTIQGQFIGGYENGAMFKLTGNTGDETFKILRKHGIIPDYKEEEKQGLLSTIFINWFPMILLFVIFFFFLRQLQAGGGKAMSFGKSKAKMLNENEKKVTFKDVSGVEEAKEELVEIVDFLKDPKKYTKLGGKIPKGVLLVGPPGTGKTLLARSVAGEAGVPFFSISGSDFVEMFVGVGASRVRDLFEQGKKAAPCIIFIDEIDAVGRHRGHGMGGGHDEREQTLNQMLVEMDGFESNEGVIIMAATNRVDVLDPALLRPGRFDRRVTVGRPDVRGRLGILKVHTKKTPLEENVNLEVIARGTPGFTGADLANLVNEAALIAAKQNKTKLATADFEKAKDKVLMGVERRSMVISDEEKRNTAYHEAGHTIIGQILPKTDPVHKVSIIPRGGALGVTLTLPDEDKLSITRERANNEIAMLLGGRLAEELVFGDYTSGASNDIERATGLARKMVCNWGMSDTLGTVNFTRNDSQPFGYGPGENNSVYSEETAKMIDEEVSKIIRKNYQLAKDILTEKRDVLENMTNALILWETLDSNQIQALMDGKDIGSPLMSSDDDDEGTTKKEATEDVAKKDDGKEGPANPKLSPA
ncbi:MAG: cell division protein FtsH [Halobacteriovoraceae bacterium]|nr:cell division protein FtsH [Halobacteriovoraceae bacterium]|tara:strand:+ start:204377 stop:206308 length:1932 start_codon:yes stop_codon:yes gene_type:complete